MDLSELRPAPGAVKVRKRIARGTGSGTGKTAGRGHKGKGSRSGGNTPPGYEGGQMPLQRRLPKRGFRPRGKIEFQLVTLEHLATFPVGATIQVADLIARGFIRRGTAPVKCLADGTLGHAVTLHVHAYSQRAKAAIEAAGGAAQVLTKTPAEVASA